MSQSNSYKAKQLAVSSKAMQLLAVSSRAASIEAKQRSKAAVISCRLAVAMPLHRCLYPTTKEQILTIYEWLVKETKVTMLHTSQAITVSTEQHDQLHCNQQQTVSGTQPAASNAQPAVTPKRDAEIK